MPSVCFGRLVNNMSKEAALTVKDTSGACIEESSEMTRENSSPTDLERP